MNIPLSLDKLLENAVALYGKREALVVKNQSMNYDELAIAVDVLAKQLQHRGVVKGDRVAVWLPKQFEVVIALFASASIGAVFVPVNPALKQRQVDYILADCGAASLITTEARAGLLSAAWTADVTTPLLFTATSVPLMNLETPDSLTTILYTSGSTGGPKGVMLSHANLCTGAVSVAGYLGITPDDRILCVPPLSFDYGLNQVLTSLHCGATAVLHDYLVPNDILKAVERHSITGLPGVPPLWSQLVDVVWPVGLATQIRYITNTGGRMPRVVLDKLRLHLPRSDIYLMYGLTESFRSTYLEPALVDALPHSIGKAVPHAEVRIVRPDGSETADGEAGELVHMGPLVALGYWQDETRSRARFRPAPACATSVAAGSIAVWSGDTVVRDGNGFMSFVARDDDMIKTSGYRVSPTEVEEVLYASGMIADAIVTGMPDDALGQSIVAAVSVKTNESVNTDLLLKFCRQELPGFMVPSALYVMKSLPRNPNGKLDRTLITHDLRARHNA